MVVVLGSMQITNRLDVEDTRTKQLILAAYIASQAVVLGISFIIHRRIQAKKDSTVFKYIEQPKPFSGEQPKEVTTTVMEYDLEQNSQVLKQNLVTLALMVFMHFKFGVIRPLIIHSILPIKNVFESKWAQVHLLGKPAVGDLARPWKADNPFAALTDIADQFKNETGIGKTATNSENETPKVESKKDL
ncbi:hypothetical protein BGX26_009737 [Mortierella sp. AD094]|nr:hypothetical protein BGX26_009737 [Mortierella sp. AD094]